MTPRRWGWLAMVILLSGAFAVGLTKDRGPSTPDERAQHVAETVMCPTCLGQSVADSESSAARGIRATIEARIKEGASDDEIRQELADSFSTSILLEPPRSGLAGLVWVLPVVALVAAVTGVVLAFRGWRSRTIAQVSEADRSLVASALSARGEAGE